MKPAAPTSTYSVAFQSRPAARSSEACTERVPRLARLLALAHRIGVMIRAGELRDFADAAQACGVTRARMTQIMNLLLLDPGIQEAILEPPQAVGAKRASVTERQLRATAAEPWWERQRAAWGNAMPLRRVQIEPTFREDP